MSVARRKAVRDRAPGSWERLRLTGTETVRDLPNPSRAAAPEGFFMSPPTSLDRKMPPRRRNGRPGSRDLARPFARRSKARGPPEGTAREAIARSTDGGASLKGLAWPRTILRERRDLSIDLPPAALSRHRNCRRSRRPGSSLVLRFRLLRPREKRVRFPPVSSVCRGAGPARSSATRVRPFVATRKARALEAEKTDVDRSQRSLCRW